MAVFSCSVVRGLCAGSVLLVLLMPVSGICAADDYRAVEFADLLPDEDYQALSNPPAALAQIEEGSAADQAAAAVGQEPAGSPAPQSEWDRALQSTTVRPEFNNQKIRIPGFVVPLEFDDDQVVTEFFLVPYYGACIHLPPPPPNQLILVQSKSGVRMETIYDPYWVEGTLYTDLNKNEVAISAYRMTVDQVELYQDEGE